MKNKQITHTLAILIGFAGIGFGIYGFLSGSPFQDYFFSILIGAVLAGTAFINRNQLKKHQNK